MKKSKKFITLFAIVLVMALCLSTFAACGAKKITDAVYQDAMVNGINGLFPENGYYFGIDAAASYTYQKGSDNVRYDLVIQGTLDSDPNVETTDSQLKVELTETKGGAKKTLLGLYYKDQPDKGAANYTANAPKLYVNLLDEYKYAFNTYSIKKLVKDVTPKSATSDMLEIGGMEIDAKTIVEMIVLTMAVEDTFRSKTVKKETHMTVELNPQLLFDSLLAPLISGNAAAIDAVLEGIGANITSKTLQELDLNIPMLLTMRYEKIKKNKPTVLLGGSLELNFDKNRPIKIAIGDNVLIDTAIPECKVTVAVDKIAIKSDTAVNIDYPAKDGYTFINPLNVYITGELNISDSSKPNAAATPYDVIIAVDANPIPVAYMGAGGWDIKEAVFNNLGTLHFSIISKDETRARAIIDLAYDPKNTGCDSVFASLNLGSFGNINTQISASALEGLVDSIAKFVNSSATSLYADPEAKALSNQSDGAITNWLEALKPALGDLLGGGLIDLLKSFGLTDADLPTDLDKTLASVETMVNGLIDAGSVKLGTIERGAQDNIFLEVNITEVASKILGSGIISIDETTLGLINQLLGVVKAIFGGDVLNLEFTSFKYGGTASNYNATRFFLTANQRTASSFIQKVVGIKNNTLAGKFQTGITAQEFMTAIEFGKVIPVDCKDYKGNAISNKSLKVMMVTGFDKNVKGTQSVTIGFMDTSGHNALSTLTNIIGGFLPNKEMMSKIPFGLIRYTVDVKFI